MYFIIKLPNRVWNLKTTLQQWFRSVEIPYAMQFSDVEFILPSFLPFVSKEKNSASIWFFLSVKCAETVKWFNCASPSMITMHKMFDQRWSNWTKFLVDWKISQIKWTLNNFQTNAISVHKHVIYFQLINKVFTEFLSNTVSRQLSYCKSKWKYYGRI